MCTFAWREKIEDRETDAFMACLWYVYQDEGQQEVSEKYHKYRLRINLLSDKAVEPQL